MGQKTNPVGFRLVIRKDWRSRWYANKKEFGKYLMEDDKIRKFLLKKACCQGTSKIKIKRMSDKIEVTIATARPGLVIGKKGAEIEILKKELSALTKKDVWVEVEEIKRPDLDAQIVADGIARQIERRIPFRRALKKAIQATMDAGAAGIKLQISGCIGGAEIARTEGYKDGSVPLHTLRADIDYAQSTANTSHGTIGIKVIINKGETVALPKKEVAA